MKSKTKNVRLMGRQGDVGFIALAIPVGAVRVALRPFALGEVTGHSHCVAPEDADGAEMYEHEGRGFLRVTKEGGISIVHEEHDPHGKVSRLPQGWEGTWRVAREYDEAEGWHAVAD